MPTPAILSPLLGEAGLGDLQQKGATQGSNYSFALSSSFNFSVLLIGTVDFFFIPSLFPLFIYLLLMSDPSAILLVPSPHSSLSNRFPFLYIKLIPISSSLLFI